MNCRECESKLAGYVLDDPSEEVRSACAAHLQTCAACREALAQYVSIVETISCEAEAAPSASESASLAMALAQVKLESAVAQPVSAQVPQGFLGFVLASAAVFVLLAVVLALQTLGAIDIIAFVRSFNPAALALTFVIIVFVTSFVPIAVTARRRPLNGMTFMG